MAYGKYELSHWIFKGCENALLSIIKKLSGFIMRQFQRIIRKHYAIIWEKHHATPDRYSNSPVDFLCVCCPRAAILDLVMNQCLEKLLNLTHTV